MSGSRLSRVLGLGVAAAAVAALAGQLSRRQSQGEAPLPPVGGVAGMGTIEAAPISIVSQVRAAMKRDNVALSAAGLAFYGLIALMPALIATISIYGLVAEPAAAESLVEDVAEALPDDARQLITDQLVRLAEAPSGGLSVGVAVSLLGVLWTVSTAFQALIKGVNDAYGHPDSRGFAALRILALGLAVGAIAVVLSVAALLTVAPSIADWLGLSSAVDRTIAILRWPAVAVLMTGGLALLYRWAPDRPAPPRWWATPGALVATGVWLLASVGFSIYVSTFGRGSYAATYGALAGVIILMFWLFMGGYAVLIGAEVNAVVERRRGFGSPRQG